MPKIACGECEVEFRIYKNECYCIEYFQDPPKPYKIWFCDAWRCPKCGALIAAGFGQEAISEHYEEGFQDLLKIAENSRDLFRMYEKG